MAKGGVGKDVLSLGIGLAVIVGALYLYKKGYFTPVIDALKSGVDTLKSTISSGGSGSSGAYGGSGGGSVGSGYTAGGGQAILSMAQCQGIGGSAACCQDAFNRGSQIKYYEATNCKKCGNKEC